MDLKSFREDKLKIKTQAEFAELIGVDQSSISRWEKDPDSIPYRVIQIILEKTGATYEELTGWKKPIPKPLDVKNTWEKADFTKRTLFDYISQTLEDKGISDEHRKAYVDDLRCGVDTNSTKPKVAIVGRSDTGKSTLINALLGMDKMPTSWTPTTSIAVYIKHISDRPSFIEEDAWVFSNKLGTENLWDERKLYDEEYCRSWKIGAGGVEILRSFGTRQGENYDKEAGAAVIFLDAPILRNCDIIDLPGFGTETESDDNITFATTQKADIVLYLSQANAFMRIEDILYLKRVINELPIWEKKGENNLKPLSNLFIIASQAHTINNGNREQLEDILNVGCTNLLKTLPSEYWRNRAEFSGYDYQKNGSKILRSRFFAYTVDIPDVCLRFNDALKAILEALPLIIQEKAKGFVRSYVETRKPNLIKEIKKYEGIVDEREKYVTLLNEIEKNELKRVRDNDKRKKGVREEIDRLSRESIDEFTRYIEETINRDALFKSLKEKKVKNKQSEIELFCSSLQSEIQNHCENILAEKTVVLSEKVKEYVNHFSENILCHFKNNSIEADFDAGWAFANTLSNISLIGGIVGGVGSFILLGSAALGPISLVAGFVIVGVISLISVLSGGWEKTVANKICASFNDNNLGEEYRKGIRQYWEQIEKAFFQAAAKLDEEWDAYVNNLRDTINGYDIQEIQSRIASLKNLSDFFEHIQL